MITMKKNTVSTYCYLSATLSHGFHPFDEKKVLFYSLPVYTKGFIIRMKTDEI